MTIGQNNKLKKDIRKRNFRDENKAQHSRNSMFIKCDWEKKKSSKFNWISEIIKSITTNIEGKKNKKIQRIHNKVCTDIYVFWVCHGRALFAVKWQRPTSEMLLHTSWFWTVSSLTSIAHLVEGLLLPCPQPLYWQFFFVFQHPFIYLQTLSHVDVICLCNRSRKGQISSSRTLWP